MVQEVIFKADGTDEEQASKITLMQVVYEAAQKYGENDPDIPYDVCGSKVHIYSIGYISGQLTVTWTDGLDMSCFGRAFNKAWAEHGDGSDVIHIDIDHLDPRYEEWWE